MQAKRTAQIAYDRINCCNDTDESFAVRNFEKTIPTPFFSYLISVHSLADAVVITSRKLASYCDLWTFFIRLEIVIHRKEFESNLIFRVMRLLQQMFLFSDVRGLYHLPYRTIAIWTTMRCRQKSNDGSNVITIKRFGIVLVIE